MTEVLTFLGYLLGCKDCMERKEKHPMYGKFLKRTKKFVAHDEEQTCNIGDTVRIMETRPMSKRKCWRLVEVIERAK